MSRTGSSGCRPRSWRRSARRAPSPARPRHRVSALCSHRRHTRAWQPRRRASGLNVAICDVGVGEFEKAQPKEARAGFPSSRVRDRAPAEAAPLQSSSILGSSVGSSSRKQYPASTRNRSAEQHIGECRQR
eukprot:6174992-Pleurochrysis_carterae.AAC.2